MSPKHLAALRKLLHFSAAEAARYVTASQDRPHGVEDRTWNRWEAGHAPIPPNVVHTMLHLAAWRRTILAGLKVIHADALGGKPHGPVALLWYDELEDWPGDAVEWRPWQSAVASLLDHAAELGQPEAFRLVRFDAQAYHRQRCANGLPDSDQQRQAWAQAQPDDSPVWRDHRATSAASTPTPV